MTNDPDLSAPVKEFEFMGGALALDFVNTVDWPNPTVEHPGGERFRGYADLIRWSRLAEAIPAGPLAQLAEAAGEDPAGAAEVSRTAREVRGVVRTVVTAAIAGRSLEPETQRRFDQLLADALTGLHVVTGGEGGAWSRRWPEPPPLRAILWPVLWQTAELLTGGELSRIRTCPGIGCGWMYFDRSRNRSRRWCDMKTCGNRAKARRHLARKRRQG